MTDNFDSFVEVKDEKDETKLSDSSFEEIVEESEPFNKVDFVVNELIDNDENDTNSAMSDKIIVDQKDKMNEETMDWNYNSMEETQPDTVVVSDNCNDNIRQVLDDVEAQIETLRERVAKIAQDKLSVVDVLDGINQSLIVTNLSELEKEEIGLEVSRLKERVEDVNCDLKIRKTSSQIEAWRIMELELNKLVSTVEQQESSTTDAEQLCRSWLAACGHQSSNVPVCHRFEKLVLDCSVKDQKIVRNRLEEILQNIVAIKQGALTDTQT